MSYIPLMVDMQGKNIYIIGGGNVAERRVKTLIGIEASLIVISTDINEYLYSLYEHDRLIWRRKKFEAADVKGADLIIAATNDKQVNQSVKTATPEHCALNMTDAGLSGNVIFPAMYRRGKLSFAVSTESASPMLVSQIIKELKSQYDHRYEEYVDFLYTCRMAIKETSLSMEEKTLFLKQILSKKYLNSTKQEEILSWLNDQN